MKPNTALSLLLLAVAVASKQSSRRFQILGKLLCGCVVVIAGLTLLEYISGHNIGIDELLMWVPADRAGDPVGRMSIGTAISALISGLAVLILDTAPVLGSVLFACAGLLGLSALVGILFDAGPLYGVPLLRSMAVRTAVCFLILQIAYFLLRPEREPTRSLLVSARHHRAGVWFVLGTCTLPLLLGWPIAVFYRHGRIDAAFSFALLVVLLIAAQALLISSNTHSLAQVEDKRARVEQDRRTLAQENERQYTDLLASEARVAESEAQYRLITDALPALIAYIGPDLRYIRVNRTYGDWFGRLASEIEGRKIEELLGPSVALIRQHLTSAFAGEPQQFETQLVTLQRERTVSVSQMPDLDVSGRVRGVIVQASDITARKETEAALRQTEKLAAVGKLASSIAHEINNPLEAVTNLLYLARSSPERSEIQQYLATAEEELGRISAITSQTLRFHRQASRPVAVNVEDMFASVLAMYQGRLLNTHIKVEQHHVPAGPLTCLDGEIRQVLNNLVGNAIDAMYGRGGRLLLRSRSLCHRETGHKGIALTVADTGEGMSAGTLASIFDAFFTTKGNGGTGLGLWVSKEIIDRHHGSLRVRSSQSHGCHGTVFRLFLPYNPADVSSNASFDSHQLVG